MILTDLPDDKEEFYQLVEVWNHLEEAGQKPEIMDVYALQRVSNINAQLWKEFLVLPQVIEELERDLRLKQRQKIAMLTESLDADSKSTGVAQLLNTMMNSYERGDKTEDTGPAFIYTFVPLNPEQMEADNVQILDHNPFIKD